MRKIVIRREKRPTNLADYGRQGKNFLTTRPTLECWVKKTYSKLLIGF
ncbi:Uncharacterised protein [Pantoea agglomerans]|uniref:Uncharacterized protein n=1 Tax=Enterobacter agglomerans TaxID=549 RepID=A0A379AGD3_ENTAG|nr:Uncharacterised protein [Pantoea agglomerans]